MNWRERGPGDLTHYNGGGGEIEGNLVYSPIRGTRDGEERHRREEKKGRVAK